MVFLRHCYLLYQAHSDISWRLQEQSSAFWKLSFNFLRGIKWKERLKKAVHGEGWNHVHLPHLYRIVAFAHTNTEPGDRQLSNEIRPTSRNWQVDWWIGLEHWNMIVRKHELIRNYGKLLQGATRGTDLPHNVKWCWGGTTAVTVGAPTRAEMWKGVATN